MLTKPIFIIALHRTGSTLLQNMIGANSAVAIATNEMQLFLPFRASFGKIFREIGDMSVEKNVDKLFRIINSGNIAGTFWREYTQLDISLALIKKRFRDSDRTLKDLIDILLSEYLSKERKSRTGVKYPLHFYKLKLLDDWFPDSKIIVLHRDIRATCASKINDEATIRRKQKFGVLIHYLTLSLFVFEYIWQAFYLRQYPGNFFFLDYDNLINDPETELKSLCEYCEIDFEPHMLRVTGKPSSFGHCPNRGIDKSRKNNWKVALSPLDKWLITTFTKKSRNIFQQWI